MPINRRAEILAHAETHFAEHGYQGASLSAIARSVGIGNPGLLHHFSSKAKLYRAVLEHLANEVMARLDSVLQTAPTPARRLRVFVTDQVEWMAVHPNGIRVIQRELLDNAERVKEAHVLPLRSYLLAALDLIEAAQKDGAARSDIPAVAVLCLILGTLSYAVVVRPTFYQAMKKSELENPALWGETMAAEVLKLIEEGGE